MRQRQTKKGFWGYFLSKKSHRLYRFCGTKKVDTNCTNFHKNLEAKKNCTNF